MLFRAQGSEFRDLGVWGFRVWGFWGFGGLGLEVGQTGLREFDA